MHTPHTHTHMHCGNDNANEYVLLPCSRYIDTSNHTQSIHYYWYHMEYSTSDKHTWQTGREAVACVLMCLCIKWYGNHVYIPPRATPLSFVIVYDRFVNCRTYHWIISFRTWQRNGEHQCRNYRCGINAFDGFANYQPLTCVIIIMKRNKALIYIIPFLYTERQLKSRLMQLIIKCFALCGMIIYNMTHSFRNCHLI